MQKSTVQAKKIGKSKHLAFDILPKTRSFDQCSISFEILEKSIKLSPVSDYFSIFSRKNEILDKITAVYCEFSIQLFESSSFQIEVLGLRNSAMVSTALIILYQLVVCQFNNLYIYLILQSLLIFNNMQMIIDAAILNMESEDGDYKKRTRLITRIMIPQSIGYALGPYCALQMIFFVTPSLEISQALCGFLAILTLLPVIWNYFPDNPNSSKCILISPLLHIFHLVQTSP